MGIDHRIYYEAAGPEEGIPLLCQHTAGCNNQQWRHILNELVEFPIPFVSELYEAEVERVEFDFPEESRFQQFAPIDPLSTPSVLHGTVTFTYPQGRSIRNYLAEDV